ALRRRRRDRGSRRRKGAADPLRRGLLRPKRLTSRDSFVYRRTIMKFSLSAVMAPLALAGFSAGALAKDVSLLNVSYDATRELYEAYYKVFAKYWKEKTGDTVTIKQSHGRPVQQARAVIDGRASNVVIPPLASDIDANATNANSIPQSSQWRLPNNSSPYTSRIVFLIRK